MPRTQITSETKLSIVTGLNKGNKPIDIARKHKVSTTFVYRVRAELKKQSVKSENNTPVTKASTTVRKAATIIKTANKPAKVIKTVRKVTEAPKAITGVKVSKLYTPSVERKLNAEIIRREKEINIRETEITSLKSTLAILSK